MLDKSASGPRAKHAVVMGGSMAGLLAAHKLSGVFEQVTILDRDGEPETDGPRKGVPQGNHAHLLLRRGAQILEEMFPGLIEELERGGASVGDWGETIRWHHFGKWKARYKSNWNVVVMTRPFLETHIRQRMAASSNIHFRYGALIKGFTTDPAVRSINGVRIQCGDGEEVVSGDLVVDATGRGSQTPRWLEKLGFASIEQTTVGIGLGYSSRFYEAPEGADEDWISMMIYPTPPLQTDAGYIMKVENNRWMVTMAGYLGHHPRTRDPFFLDFARRLPSQAIHQQLKNAKPLTDVKTYKYPEESRRHYEKAELPDGLVVVGDAACSFDPVFGQGMTVAALEAQALEKSLRARQKDGAPILKGFPKRFHRRTARILKTPWLLATSEAFRWPLTEGRRPFGIPFLQWYTGKVFVIAHHSSRVYDALLNVLHMTAGPISLFKPGIFSRVLLKTTADVVRSWLPSPVKAEGDPVGE